MTKVGIIGASGYSGLELIKIMLNHPGVNLSFVSGTSRVAGQKLYEVFPVLRSVSSMEFVLTDIKDLIKSGVDCIFLATPNETSLELIPTLMSESNINLIDLSGSFRLKDNSLYPPFYGFENNYTSILDQAIYGLPELNRSAIRNARLLANPGCYPTSIILPLVPLLASNLVDTNQRIIIDSKSGVSGAGRKPTENTHYVETNESLKAYNVHKHRHEPEINQEISKAANKPLKVTFTPHLVPVNRGILSTIYVELKEKINVQEVLNILNNAYNDDRFVRVLKESQLPEIKHVAYTPYCDIGVSLRDNQLVIVSCIDNLLKGASSQAVQNFNLMHGYREELGL